MDTKLRSQLDQFHSIEDFKVLYPPVSFTGGVPPSLITFCLCQEEMTGSGKRSRNPSTSSGYGVRLGGYRSRRASEGDEGGPGGPGSLRGGGGSRGGSRHNSGGGGPVKPYRGRHSDESNSWVISSSYQVSVLLPPSALS